MKRSHPERQRGISSVHLETLHFVQGETVEIIQQSQKIIKKIKNELSGHCNIWFGLREMSKMAF